jgi:hypothetical protein
MRELREVKQSTGEKNLDLSQVVLLPASLGQYKLK